MIRAGAWTFTLVRDGERYRLHRVESRIVGGREVDHVVEHADKSGTAHEIAVYLHSIDSQGSVKWYVSVIEEEIMEGGTCE